MTAAWTESAKIAKSATKKTHAQKASAAHLIRFFLTDVKIALVVLKKTHAPE